ncbi:MAG: hypothetical protein WCK55_00150 [Verrucomicrobiota bacterium]
MSSKANVTTPGGFFVGLGGIVSFCVVAAAVWWWVKSPSANAELRPQQIALGLRAPDDAKGDDAKKKAADTDALLKAAAKKYNGGTQPNLDKLDDLRGVIRFRESDKLKAEAEKALTVAPVWKDKAKGDVTMPIELAMKAVANNLKDRKPKASAVKVDALPVLDPNAAPMMPNAMGGGAKTVIFADPNAPVESVPTAPSAAPAPTIPAAAPAAPAAPATAPAATPAAPAPAPAAPANPAPAPAPGGASAAVPAPTIASIPAPARPALLNWPESTK